MSSVSAVGGICAISELTGRIAVNRMETQLDADRITGWKQTPIPAPPPPARDVPTGHTRGPARDGPPLFFLNNLRSVNTECMEARGHGGDLGEDVVPIAQLISIPQMRE